MQAVLVMFRSDGERRSFSISREMTVIGRRQDCDLMIPLGEISRKHCRIIRDGDELRLEDLGSSNGTFYNGKRVQETALSAGDTIQVGPVSFVVQIDGVPSDEDAQPHAGPGAHARRGSAASAAADDFDADDDAPVALGDDDEEDALAPAALAADDDELERTPATELDADDELEPLAEGDELKPATAIADEDELEPLDLEPPAAKPKGAATEKLAISGDDDDDDALAALPLEDEDEERPPGAAHIHDLDDEIGANIELADDSTAGEITLDDEPPAPKTRRP